MTCNCIDSVNKQLKPLNSELVHTLGFGGKPCRVVVQTSKVGSRQRGQATAMLATFCPFCGERYAPPEDASLPPAITLPEDGQRPSTPEDGQAVTTR